MGVLSAVAAQAFGWVWVPYGVVSITAGLAAGLFIAFLADALFPSKVFSAHRSSPASDTLGDRANLKAEPCSADTLRQRMSEEKAALEHLDAERQRRGDSRFGKTTEDRIVWGQLIDLELQEIDEQVSRICGSAGREPKGLPPNRTCAKEVLVSATIHESLNLNSEELAILAELLESERAKLLIEIRHTDHRAFRDELHRRLAVVEKLAERWPIRLSGQGSQIAP